MRITSWICLVVVALTTAAAAAGRQTAGVREEFIATAIVNNELATGAGQVRIRVERWSTAAERQRLLDALLQKGPATLLDELAGMPVTGRVTTPGSIGYDLRFAWQRPTEEGGRRVTLATDRPLAFSEIVGSTRTSQYPFTVIQMEFDRDGRGRGTLSYATRVLAHDNIIELEDFATSPIRLTSIESHPISN